MLRAISPAGKDSKASELRIWTAPWQWRLPGDRLGRGQFVLREILFGAVVLLDIDAAYAALQQLAAALAVAVPDPLPTENMLSSSSKDQGLAAASVASMACSGEAGDLSCSAHSVANGFISTGNVIFSTCSPSTIVSTICGASSVSLSTSPT
jgi:hypothetical protein